MKFFLSLTIALLLAASAAPAGSQNVFFEGEELVWEVSYAGIKLGSIKTICETEVDLRGKTTYKAKAYLQSYEGIPFIYLKTIYESWIDETLSYSHQFKSLTYKENGDKDIQIIDFDYNDDEIISSKAFNGRVYRRDTVSTSKKWNDGLALLFLARQYSTINRKAITNVFIDVEQGSAIINFRNQKEKIKISSTNYPVKTVFLDGEANFNGVYGFAGYFKGYFTDDETRIPVLAYLNLYLGRAKIELVSWKRGDWRPPKAD